MFSGLPKGAKVKGDAAMRSRGLSVRFFTLLVWLDGACVAGR